MLGPWSVRSKVIYTRGKVWLLKRRGIVSVTFSFMLSMDGMDLWPGLHNQWCSPGMLTRGLSNRGETSVLRLGGGGGGELVLPDRKGVSEVVPSFPKIVGERSIFHYHFFLSLLLFNLRYSNIFKICPTKLYGYTRWDRDRGYHPHHTHQGSFVPVL